MCWLSAKVHWPLMRLHFRRKSMLWGETFSVALDTFILHPAQAEWEECFLSRASFPFVPPPKYVRDEMGWLGNTAVMNNDNHYHASALGTGGNSWSSEQNNSWKDIIIMQFVLFWDANWTVLTLFVGCVPVYVYIYTSNSKEQIKYWAKKVALVTSCGSWRTWSNFSIRYKRSLDFLSYYPAPRTGRIVQGWSQASLVVIIVLLSFYRFCFVLMKLYKMIHDESQRDVLVVDSQEWKATGRLGWTLVIQRNFCGVMAWWSLES